MRAAQGRTLEDGTYVYTCGLCHGKGNNANCPWCYGLNLNRIVEEMQKGARGARYYSLLKAHHSITGKQMVDEWKRLKAERGEMNVQEIGYLSLKYRLNFKATWEWLEETRCVRVAYDNFARGKLTVREVYAWSRERYPQLAEASVKADGE